MISLRPCNHALQAIAADLPNPTEQGVEKQKGPKPPFFRKRPAQLSGDDISAEKRTSRELWLIGRRGPRLIALQLEHDGKQDPGGNGFAVSHRWIELPANDCGKRGLIEPFVSA
jgi:hypothetical protein